MKLTGLNMSLLGIHLQSIMQRLVKKEIMFFLSISILMGDKTMAFSTLANHFHLLIVINPISRLLLSRIFQASSKCALFLMAEAIYKIPLGRKMSLIIFMQY